MLKLRPDYQHIETIGVGTFLILNLKTREYEVWYKVTNFKNTTHRTTDRLWRSVPIRFHHKTGQRVH